MMSNSSYGGTCVAKNTQACEELDSQLILTRNIKCQTCTSDNPPNVPLHFGESQDLPCGTEEQEIPLSETEEACVAKLGEDIFADMLHIFTTLKLPGICSENAAGLCFSALNTIVGLYHSDNLVCAFSHVISFLQINIGRDNISKFSQVINGVQQGFNSPHSTYDPIEKDPAWLDLMKLVRDNWQLAVKHKFFHHLSRMMGIMVLVGMADKDKLTITWDDWVLWEPHIFEKHTNLPGLVEMVLDTVVFYAEKVHLTIKHRSLKPFVCDDSIVADMDVDYANIIADFDHVKTGNFERIKKQPEHVFEVALDDLIDRVKTIMRSINGLERKVFQDRYCKLMKIKSELQAIRLESSIRESPFCINFFGESGVGKSTLSSYIIVDLLTSQGLPTSKKYWANYESGEKHTSSLKSSTLVWRMDDVGNSKAETGNSANQDPFVSAKNNVPANGIMAELEAKAKVWMLMKFIMMTSNFIDAKAFLKSNCPYSYQKRMDYCVETFVRKEVQNQKGEIDWKKSRIRAQEQNDPDGVVPDNWLVTVWQVVNPGPGNIENTASYAVVEDPVFGRLEKIDARTLSNFLVKKALNHSAVQKAIVRASEEYQPTICGYDNCRFIRGSCPLHSVAESERAHDDMMKAEAAKDGVSPHSSGYQVGALLADSVSVAATGVASKLWTDFFGVTSIAEACMSKHVNESYKLFTETWHWTLLLPTKWVESDLVQYLAMFLDSDKIRKNYVVATVLLWLIWFFFSLLIILDGTHARKLVILLSLIAWYVQASMASIVRSLYLKELRSKRQMYPEFKSWVKNHERYLKGFMGTLVSLAACGLIVKMARTFFTQATANLEPQSGNVQSSPEESSQTEELVVKVNKDAVPQPEVETSTNILSPKTDADISKRDGMHNEWTSVCLRPLGISDKSASTDAERLSRTVDSNQLFCSRPSANDSLDFTNAVFVKSNFFIIPNHYYREGDELEMRRHAPNDAGGRFKVKLGATNTYHIPGTDYRICFTLSGGSYTDITPYLIEDHLSSDRVGEFRMVWRNNEGTLAIGKGLYRGARTTNGAQVFQGGNYVKTDFAAYPGLCMASVLHSAGSGSAIIGFHLGGESGVPNKGSFGTLLASEVEDGIENLRSQSILVMETGSAGNFKPHASGVDVVERVDPHPKSPVLYQPKGSQVKYLGRCPGRARPNTNVKVLKISESVIDRMGEPNVFGPPKLKPHWFGTQMALSNSALPAKEFPPDMIEFCARDYQEPLIEEAKKVKLKPLTDDENINGIDGMLFIDATKKDTSIGFPRSGVKRDYMVETFVDTNLKQHYTYDDEVSSSIREHREMYASGERAYPIAKACRKDEVLDKPKQRIFYANAVELVYLVRQYFLPVMRLVMLHPLVSECSVGVNAHGPDWEELQSHMFKFGKDRIIAGDYGKYDQKLSSQLVGASLKILINIAREAEYSEEDLAIMEAMVGDIVYAVVAYDGDLLEFTCGTHISGNSATVIINGICGSLNLRCVLYLLCAEFRNGDFSFRDVVALSTYGDDNSGSTSSKLEGFTIKAISQVLGEYGQIYTMPDKESELTDYLPEEEWEFLKRKNVYNEDLGMHLGALSQKSISKSLHCQVRPKGCDGQDISCARNIDGALREYFAWGREVYEIRRSQLQLVASDNDIAYLCCELDTSYDEALLRWRDKYTPTSDA